MRAVRMTIGEETFLARLETAAAPKTSATFLARLPYEPTAVHARWSGEALWIPTGERPGAPEPENLLQRPGAGQVLWYGGGISEPEVLIPYGHTRFACAAGPLSGNHVLTVVEGLERLRQAGEAVLWSGARKIRFETM
jgi:hypothetical protein